MRAIRILAFGPVGYVTPFLVGSWRHAGVELVGHITSIEMFQSTKYRPADGAVIDLAYSTEMLMALADLLDQHAIPSVFATASRVEPGYRGFELSSRSAAMNAILSALLDPNDTARH